MLYDSGQRQVAQYCRHQHWLVLLLKQRHADFEHLMLLLYCKTQKAKDFTNTYSSLFTTVVNKSQRFQPSSISLFPMKLHMKEA